MTDQYAVIGNPISQSKSPQIHASFALATGQDLVYSAILGPTDSVEAFAQVVRDFAANGGRGMNVTAPFKLQAFDLATDKLERAESAGATNVLKFEGQRIVADNFDGIGLVNDIQRNIGLSLAGKRVLMLGAGGAARGALLPILAERPAEVVVANRDVAKAQALAARFSGHGRIVGCGYGDIGSDRFDVVINATSASLKGVKGELPPLAAQAFNGDGLAYEMVYGKGLTPFLRMAHEAGVRHIADGVGMLVEQAAQAFEWWRGVRPQTKDLIRQLTVPLR